MRRPPQLWIDDAAVRALAKLEQVLREIGTRALQAAEGADPQ
ncbi:hypothetical protein ACQP1O_13125 [Nocardia sp. CA-151230]